MTPNPCTVAETASITHALQEMRRSGVRRVPVIGARGELVGILFAPSARRPTRNEVSPSLVSSPHL